MDDTITITRSLNEDWYEEDLDEMTATIELTEEELDEIYFAMQHQYDIGDVSARIMNLFVEGDISLEDRDKLLENIDAIAYRKRKYENDDLSWTVACEAAVDYYRYN